MEVRRGMCLGSRSGSAGWLQCRGLGDVDLALLWMRERNGSFVTYRCGRRRHRPIVRVFRGRETDRFRRGTRRVAMNFNASAITAYTRSVQEMTDKSRTNCCRRNVGRRGAVEVDVDMIPCGGKVKLEMMQLGCQRLLKIAR